MPPPTACKGMSGMLNHCAGIRVPCTCAYSDRHNDAGSRAVVDADIKTHGTKCADTLTHFGPSEERSPAICGLCHHITKIPGEKEHAANICKHETSAVSILRAKSAACCLGASGPIIKTRNNMATHHEAPVAGNTNGGLGKFFSKWVALDCSGCP